MQLLDGEPTEELIALHQEEGVAVPPESAAEPYDETLRRSLRLEGTFTAFFNVGRRRRQGLTCVVRMQGDAGPPGGYQEGDEKHVQRRLG